MATLVAVAAEGLAAAGSAQALAGVLALRALTRPAPPFAGPFPPISVLKPLHGDEVLLEQALESFFRQDYPEFELIFGVADAADRACAHLDSLARRFPHVAMRLVIEPAVRGPNRKIGNLANMLPAASHDLLVISDSDMHAAPDYLRRVAEAYAPAGVGLVTSLYSGKLAAGGAVTRLGATYINQVFASGAALARYLGREDCLGATMALSRRTLARVGGFPALLPYVADDGVLGRKVRALGLRIGLARTVPATTVPETRLAALFRHELRWARTIRAMAPVGFLLSAVQFPTGWAILACLAASGARWSAAGLAAAVLVRVATGAATERMLGAALSPWLAPVRDLMSLLVMAASFAGKTVTWRDAVLSTEPDRAFAAGEGAETPGELASGDLLSP